VNAFVLIINKMFFVGSDKLFIIVFCNVMGSNRSKYRSKNRALGDAFFKVQLLLTSLAALMFEMLLISM